MQNYIDDLGVQVADIVSDFASSKGATSTGVRALADSSSTRFDYYCWDLYSRVTDWYEGDKERLAIRARTLHDLEHGGNAVSDLADFIVETIVRAHLRTMERLNIAYDLLTYEGDIVRLQFWTRAFEILKAQGAVFLRTDGKLAGCWVMRIEEGDASAEDADEESKEKVIVRSNGVVTYVGKDIANQFWKFGLLGRDFRYRRFATQSNGQLLWATTSGESDPAAPAFGRAKRIYNVIDSRQMYLQALLSQALRTLGHPGEAENSVHFSYEMVALSHATARELGTRSRLQVKRRSRSSRYQAERGSASRSTTFSICSSGRHRRKSPHATPTFTTDECQRTGSQIAVAAIRYFMLKFSRGKLIVFDIEEALSFEGETGPYLQYAVVRANNIFHKLQEREGLTEAGVLAAVNVDAADELTSEADSALWAVVFEAARLDDVVEQVVRSLEFSVLAKYAFGLAQMFNAFYHRYPVLGEEDVNRKRWRAAGVAYFRGQLTRTLELMGIAVPTRM